MQQFQYGALILMFTHFAQHGEGTCQSRVLLEMLPVPLHTCPALPACAPRRRYHLHPNRDLRNVRYSTNRQMETSAKGFNYEVHYYLKSLERSCPLNFVSGVFFFFIILYSVFLKAFCLTTYKVFIPQSSRILMPLDPFPEQFAYLNLTTADPAGVKGIQR